MELSPLSLLLSRITGLTAEQRSFYLQLISLLPYVEHRLAGGRTIYVVRSWKSLRTMPSDTVCVGSSTQ